MMSFVLLNLYIHFVQLYQAFTHACKGVWISFY